MPWRLYLGPEACHQLLLARAEDPLPEELPGVSSLVVGFFRSVEACRILQLPLKLQQYAPFGIQCAKK